MLESIDRTTELELIAQVDRSEMSRHLDFFEGLTRVSGSEDERKAASYIIETLEEYGVDASLEEFKSYVSVPQGASLEVSVPKPYTIEKAITASFGGSTPAHGSHGELVRLDKITEESVAERDLKGRIVFSEGLPTPQLVRLVESSGATGLVLQSPTESQLHEMIVTPVWGTPSVATKSQIPDLPVIQVGTTDGDWLRDRLEGGPVEATMNTSVTTVIRDLPVPIGRIEGAESDRYFLLGNHVDSWHEGVTDNATAMAATLEIARIFIESVPKRGLVLGFWPAHSTGRYAGSAWFADENWLDLRRNGVAYLHLDLNGLQGATHLVYQQMAELESEGLDAMEKRSTLEIAGGDDDSPFGGGTRPARRGDMSFWGTGLSSLQIGGRLEPGTQNGGPIGGGWWWHTPEDTRDKVDMDILVDETELYIAIASRICNSAILPHDFRRTVEDIREVLDEVVDESGHRADDFEPIHETLDNLEKALNKAYRTVEEANGDPKVASRFEDLQVELGNRLIPPLYMKKSEYEHDPALPQKRLPGLRIAGVGQDTSGRDRLFRDISLRRHRTRLHHRIRQAMDRTQEFLNREET